MYNVIKNNHEMFENKYMEKFGTYLLLRYIKIVIVCNVIVVVVIIRLDVVVIVVCGARR